MSVHEKVLNPILDCFREVFRDELGTYNGPKVKTSGRPSDSPKILQTKTLTICNAWQEQQLQYLQIVGIIEPVESSEWATPVVPILKCDKKMLRLCGDYHLTINWAVKLHQHPIPKIEDLLTKIATGKYFTLLDIRQAYQQLLLHDESKKLVIINTHKGLFVYNRLPYLVSSTPGIFQRTVETLLQGIPNVLMYLDDILVLGKTTEEHCHMLSEVLSRLEQAGLRLMQDKCTFMATLVQYLGYQIDA